MMSHHKRPRAFTLVELLVVIGIIALLISILLPTLARARDSAKSVKCGSNARQLATGLIGYAQDFQGQFPLGYMLAGHPLYIGQEVLPPVERAQQAWIYSVSGYLNSARVGGYELPWLGSQVLFVDPNDNYHPVLYCPHVSTDFDNMFTHYGINNTIMPDWAATAFPPFGNLIPKTNGSKNMAQLYGDNALLWDGQQQKFADVSFHHRTGGSMFQVPSFAFTGVDFSALSYWALQERDWDRIYRADEGEDPTAITPGDAWRSAEFSAMINLPNLGEYWYPGFLEHLRGQEDLTISGGWYETDCNYAPIMRNNGKTRCNTAFVDGSVRGLGYNPKEKHPAVPGGPYAVGELTRQHLRTKWPSQLPQPIP